MEIFALRMKDQGQVAGSMHTGGDLGLGLMMLILPGVAASTPPRAVLLSPQTGAGTLNAVSHPNQ